jgi:hypothetical protein
MGAAVDYAERAAEWRRLAKVYTRSEDWAHFIEMAETWEMLLKQQQEELKQQQEESRLKTIALADRFRNVLFLSEIATTKVPQAHNEEAA